MIWEGMEISERYDVNDDDSVPEVVVHSHKRQIGSSQYMFTQVTTNAGTTILVTRLVYERAHVVSVHKK